VRGVVAIIPAKDEAAAIAEVVAGALPHVDRVIVVDNGSTDETAEKARAAGAQVIAAPVAGYGRACLAGIAASDEDIIVFLDGDAADDPDDLPALVEPVLSNRADLVIGSRLSGRVEPGALTLAQRFGNRLACFLMNRIWGAPFTDLGPFRAIRRSKLDRLDLDAKTYGWTVQMQVRALRRGLRVGEVPVHYRRRIGTSKISGTVKGVFLAGVHILGVIGREGLADMLSRQK